MLSFHRFTLHLNEEKRKEGKKEKLKENILKNSLKKNYFFKFLLFLFFPYFSLCPNQFLNLRPSYVLCKTTSKNGTNSPGCKSYKMIHINGFDISTIKIKIFEFRQKLTHEIYRVEPELSFLYMIYMKSIV